jgi:hypothetical protein
MYEGLIKKQTPSAARAIKAEEGVEAYLTEGAVAVAFAMQLLRTIPGLNHVAIHPDGEHAKNFDFVGWLGTQGFVRQEAVGTTNYAGVYRSGAGQTILINPKSGLGDVVADVGGHSYLAECKGGVINTKHAGQLSRLRKGLCEALGLSLATELVEGRRQFAVAPKTATTVALARKMAVRAKAAGVEIALVDGFGNVEEIRT